MKIVCMNDQILPLDETDAEQTIAMVCALVHEGADVGLLLPWKWGKAAVSIEEIKKYYEINADFSVTAIHSAFPSLRAVEKISHGARGIFDPSFTSADVIYTRNLPSVLASLAMGRKPVVYETYRLWPDQQRILRPVISWITRHPRFLGAVFHSKLAENSFLKNGLSKKKSLVAYNGYNPELMLPVLSKDAARRKLQLPLDRHIVTYTGSIGLNKGLDILLDMARVLRHVHFVLVGSRGHYEIEKLAQSIANVQIIPRQKFSETAQFLYASDILVIPPTALPLEKIGTTVLPLKTFLYMATRRPIFGPSTPDLREILEDGDNAVLVDTNATLTSICMALDHLLQAPNKQEHIATRAFADVAVLTWENRAKQVLAFIEKRLRK